MTKILPQPWDTDQLHGINYGALPRYPQVEPTSYKFDLALFIMRGQLMHTEHERAVQRALDIGAKALVVIGSAGKARDTRNPFLFEERKAVLLERFKNDPRLIVVPQGDYPYNDTMWASYIRKAVATNTAGISNPRIALVGHRKSDTNFYIDMFDKWEFVETGVSVDICASDLRKILFDDKLSQADRIKGLAPYVSSVSMNQAITFAYNADGTYTDEMQRLMREASFIKRHAASWANAPYAPTFVTVDAIVIQSGHVLLIKRRSAPGEGLLALPGGYLDPGERIKDAMVRELYEETRLKVPRDVIRGSIRGTEVYDFPSRSLRGRIITHASCVQLKDGKLAQVKAASDAKAAFWMPLEEFYASQHLFFEDHWHIICDMIQRFVK